MTAENSCIVLTEGLPPAPIASELLKQLPHYAPELVAYLDQCQSELIAVDLSQSRCTALEHWQLHQANFSAPMAKHNAALALLLASQQQKNPDPKDKNAFWLVELVHISPARDGAALIPAVNLNIEVSQNADLLQSAQTLCEGTPFQLSAWSNTHWQLHSDITLPATFASSSLVSRTSVNDWWDQDPRSRDWRRFVNEIQMLFFNHPVNLQRQQQGLLSINSLWPVGGISPADWQPQPKKSLVFTQLSDSYLRQEWGQWLVEMQSIQEHIIPLLHNQPEIVFSNTTHYMKSQFVPRRFWQRLFNSTPAWRNHWLVQS